MILADTPIAYWRFNALLPGNIVVDEISGNDLTALEGVNSGVTTGGIGNTGFINNDLSYPENRGFAMTTSIDSTTLTSGYSTEGWLYFNIPNSGQSYVAATIGMLTGTKDGLEVWASGPGGSYAEVLEYYIYGATDNAYVDIPAASLWNTWIHIVTTTDSSGNYKIYQNGVEVLSGTGAPDLLFDVVGTDGWWEYIDGKIDEIALYDYVLTPTQITDHYNAGVAAL
jgi:hypothetical protein